MKITVITNEKGNIIGTARFPKKSLKNQPVLKPMLKEGQSVYEIELPSHLKNIKSAEELHQELKRYIKN